MKLIDFVYGFSTVYNDWIRRFSSIWFDAIRFVSNIFGEKKQKWIEMR